MAMVPVSLVFEIFLILLGLLLMDYHLVGRFSSLGCFMFAISQIVQNQVYIVESAGTITTVTAAYPAAISGTFVFLMVLLEYTALASIFDWLGRDIFGRKR